MRSVQKASPFEKLYYEAMERLQEIIYFKKLTTEAYKSHQQINLKIFRESYTKSESDEELKKNVDKAIKVFAKAGDYPPLIYKMSLVYAISIFDIYFNGFLAAWFAQEPRSLKTSKKSLTYEEILSENSKTSILKRIIKRELHEVGYKSIIERFDYLKSKTSFGFPNDTDGKGNFFNNLIDYNRLTELYSTRNLIVHNNTVINEIYLRDNLNSKFKHGKERPIDAEYVANGIIFLMQIVAKMYFKTKEYKPK